MFYNARKEFMLSLLEPKPRFSTAPTGSSGTSGSASSKSKPELTKNEQRIYTSLKIMAVFLPGVYIGHVMTSHGFFENSEDEENGKNEKNGDKDKNGKEKGKKDKM